MGAAVTATDFGLAAETPSLDSGLEAIRKASTAGAEPAALATAALVATVAAAPPSDLEVAPSLDLAVQSGLLEGAELHQRQSVLDSQDSAFLHWKQRFRPEGPAARLRAAGP